MLRATMNRSMRVIGFAPRVLGDANATRLVPNMQALDAFSCVISPASKTNEEVWSAPTLHSAWTKLDKVLRNAGEDNRKILIENDLVALSKCTAEAEVQYLLMSLPASVRNQITSQSAFSYDTIEEIFFHVGQDIEVRGYGWQFSAHPPTTEDLQYILNRVGKFAEDGRGNISSTLHRVSCWKGKRGEILGVTLRVGRFSPNCASSLLPLAERGNLLLLSKPGAGKTTMLRDLAASIARLPSQPRVVVIDTSNEIGGDGVVPLPFLGRTRRVQVPKRSEQLRVMTEVLQNHSPEYVVIDEIGTQAEAEAAWSISQRGIKLIATCHGENLNQLLQNRELNILVGGVSQAFLSNEERRLRNKVKKTVLERPYSSPFHSVVELMDRGKAFVYTNVNSAVDLILNDEDARKHVNLCAEADLRLTLPTTLFPSSEKREVVQTVTEDGYTQEQVVPQTGNSRNHRRERRNGGPRSDLRSTGVLSEIDQFL